MPNVVVTGRAAITPVGLDWAESWQAMTAGRSGIDAVSCVDVSDLPVRIAGEVKGFVPDSRLPTALLRRTSRTVHLALSATLRALDDAALRMTETLAPRTGVVLGHIGLPTDALVAGDAALESAGPLGISPYAFASQGVVTCAAETALQLGARGPCLSVATACATGATCIGQGMRLIQEGAADVVIAGGADDTITRYGLATGARARALSRRNDEPRRASRPFDRARDGFVMSAGAGVLILESAEHAAARDARILAELAGYASTMDGFHLTAPDPQGAGASAAMRGAMDEARIGADDVGYINAHGTSTPLNDKAEAETIRKVFGARSTTIPVSSVKSMIGHSLGAAGAIEALVAVETINTGIVPPTINCDDPEDPAMNFVAHQAQEHRVDVVMSNSFGFGGHNAILLIRRWRNSSASSS
ncbi:beta-ketoacyl-ACP synthase II [Actinomadura sp. KC06]|uniref:beta-ketoacyl-[acyl-carrier-protein] synthase family protein n=1 Tax=Actinomadura sp. KC06 TaxID=2530369 RepID=UPI001052D837|nr:beta-ketoacyl-ACP synthase II [Actinomadura sp. KC06]TDD37554.1 beta-ketoacyl-ACP synthase II [Actinomadura sp. KC06]